MKTPTSSGAWRLRRAEGAAAFRLLNRGGSELRGLRARTLRHFHVLPMAQSTMKDCGYV
jgi:hypothetical protein